MAVAPGIIINLPPLPINRLDSVSSIAALRAVPSASLENGQDIAVDGLEQVGDGGGGLFTWSELSTKDDDGATIIKPNDIPPLAAGRWILLAGNSAAIGFPTANPRILEAATEGQTEYLLNFAPGKSTALFINGTRLTPSGPSFSGDYTVDGYKLTFDVPLNAGDIPVIIPNEVALVVNSVMRYGAVGDGLANDDAPRIAAEASLDDVYWPEGTYILNSPPSIYKSWGPGICMVGGNRVYLRPTPEPVQEVLAEIFGLYADGIQDDAPALQRAMDFAQSFNLPVRFPLNASIYLATGLTMKQGRALTGDPFIYDAKINFNGCTIYPGSGVIALSIVPRCLLANASVNGKGNVELYGDVTFDGSKGNASSGAIKIGTPGYFCSPFNYGNVANMLIHLFPASAPVLSFIEARHFQPEDVSVRAGQLLISSQTVGGFCGDLIFDKCDFQGAAGGTPPVIIKAQAPDGGTIGKGAQCRGIRFKSSTFYGPNVLLHAIGTADVGDIWFDTHQFEGPYDGTTGGRALDIIADGASARVFEIFTPNSYASGHKGPFCYARGLNGGDIRALHFGGLGLAAFTISAATALDANCNAVFAFKSVRGAKIHGVSLNSIIGDGNTLVVNIQDSFNVSVVGLTGDNFTAVSAGVIGAGTTDKMTAIGNMLQVTTANIALNLGSGTQNIIANNLKVT